MYDNQRTGFENLRVYQLAEAIADVIWEVVSKWNNFDKDTVGKQIVKSADSIGANIAEGSGRYGVLDNKRFVYFARGSLNETKPGVQTKSAERKRDYEIEDAFIPQTQCLHQIDQVISGQARDSSNERRTTNHEQLI